MRFVDFLDTKSRWSPRRWALILACVLLGLVGGLRTRYRLTIAFGDSMLPTYKSWQLLVVDQRAYKKGEPERFDLVVARKDLELLAKRIVGLPGEEVEVRNGILYINCVPIREPVWGRITGPLNIEAGKLLPGKFAIVGDNRSLPSAQATCSVVSKQKMVGKVVFSVPLWPY